MRCVTRITPLQIMTRITTCGALTTTSPAATRGGAHARGVAGAEEVRGARRVLCPHLAIHTPSDGKRFLCAVVQLRGGFAQDKAAQHANRLGARVSSLSRVSLGPHS